MSVTHIHTTSHFFSFSPALLISSSFFCHLAGIEIVLTSVAICFFFGSRPRFPSIVCTIYIKLVPRLGNSPFVCDFFQRVSRNTPTQQEPSILGSSWQEAFSCDIHKPPFFVRLSVVTSTLLPSMRLKCSRRGRVMRAWICPMVVGVAFVIIFLLPSPSLLEKPPQSEIIHPSALEHPPNSLGLRKISKEHQEAARKNPIKIVLYTDHFDGRNWSAQFPYGPHRWIQGQTCSDCQGVCTYAPRTDSAADFQADAWMLLDRRMPPSTRLLSLRRTAGPKIKWVFYGGESPVYSDVLSPEVRYIFNLTLTYRLESDVLDPYGLPIPLKNDSLSSVESATIYEGPTHHDSKKNATMHAPWQATAGLEAGVPYRKEGGRRRGMWAQKSKEIFWVASHCVLERDYVAHRLRVLLEGVDIFGSCNNRPLKDSVEQMAQHYKFYFAFENSFCPDYVTEKYWNVVGKAIPIVMGSTTTRTLIPNSYIRVEDFPTLEALATHVRRVSRDEDLYNSYFDWMDRYAISSSWINGEHWACRLCRYLIHTRGSKQVTDLTHFASRDLCTVPEMAREGLVGKYLRYVWFEIKKLQRWMGVS